MKFPSSYAAVFYVSVFWVENKRSVTLCSLCNILAQNHFFDLPLRIYIFCFHRLFQTVELWAIMQHDPTRTLPVFLLCKRGPSMTSPGEVPCQNFAETLPTEMSVKIFSELDAESLCSASRTCKLWHHIIEESQQLWRRHCLLVRAICQKEVDSDRRNGLSWKVGHCFNKKNDTWSSCIVLSFNNSSLCWSVSCQAWHYLTVCDD